MLSDDQAAVLIKFLKNVELNSDQEKRLITLYWEANDEERKEIARAYAYLFSKRSFAIQLLDYVSPPAGQNNSNSTSSGHSGSGPESPLGSPSNRQGSTRRIQTQMRLRTAIDEQFSKLSGPGPFPISFGLVKTEEERREVIALFASQFEHPDPPEIQRLVLLPQTFNTRTRRRISGSYTWTIRSLTTGEVACAVLLIAHHHGTHHFVEMPLFATAVGYKNNGLGRLLNAAITAWCTAASFEFIMISADIQAIPFWKHLGYRMMVSKEMKSIEFYYQHECYKFKGAEAMIGYCSSASEQMYGSETLAKTVCSSRLQQVLSRMTKFVVVGCVGLEE